MQVCVHVIITKVGCPLVRGGLVFARGVESQGGGGGKIGGLVVTCVWVGYFLWRGFDSRVCAVTLLRGVSQACGCGNIAKAGVSQACGCGNVAQAGGSQAGGCGINANAGGPSLVGGVLLLRSAPVSCTRGCITQTGGSQVDARSVYKSVTG